MRDPLTQPDDGDMATEDDASLAAAALRSPDAFAALYDRYADRVYRYVHARVAAGQDAEDLVQTIFLLFSRCCARSRATTPRGRRSRPGCSGSPGTSSPTRIGGGARRWRGSASRRRSSRSSSRTPPRA